MGEDVYKRQAFIQGRQHQEDDQDGQADEQRGLGPGQLFFIGLSRPFKSHALPEKYCWTAPYAGKQHSTDYNVLITNMFDDINRCLLYTSTSTTERPRGPCSGRP